MQPMLLKEEVQGCCFSIGLGDGMVPCCLKTAASVGLSACHTGSRMGGTTGFTTGACPSTAVEAHESMQQSTDYSVESMQNGVVVSSSSVSFVLVAGVSFAAGALATVVGVSYRR